MVQRRRIAVLTPVSHLDGVKELLETKGDVFFDEHATKRAAKDLLISEEIDTIICNPNRQGYLIDEDLLKRTKVNTINTCSTGINHIDMAYCNKKGIKVLSLSKDYELLNDLPSTSELAFGLLLDLSRNITKSNNQVRRDGVWDYEPYIGNQIKDMNIGIVGYGRLGKMMEKFCRSFGASVHIYDPYVEEKMFQKVDTIEELFDICDAISLHVHVSEETKYMINQDLLKNHKIKYLINTSRGEIIDEDAIIGALISGHLKGYGTDVLEHEFDDVKSSPLLNYGELNYIVTPHVGGMTIEGQTKAFKYAINKLEDIDEGTGDNSSEDGLETS